MPESFRSCTFDTAIGDVTVVASEHGAVAVSTGPRAAVHERLARDLRIVADEDAALAAELEPQFDDYFDGERRRFDIALDWRFVTGFARDALRAVCGIPYGETASYGEIAAAAGRPRAARAVGTACRTTPFSLVVPVHRVVRADGSLGEYGGNEGLKKYLVELERRHSGTTGITEGFGG